MKWTGALLMVILLAGAGLWACEGGGHATGDGDNDPGADADAEGGGDGSADADADDDGGADGEAGPDGDADGGGLPRGSGQTHGIAEAATLLFMEHHLPQKGAEPVLPVIVHGKAGGRGQLLDRHLPLPEFPEWMNVGITEKPA